MEKKTELNGRVYDIFVDINIINIHKNLMKKAQRKKMFGLIKKIFIGLLTGTVNASNHKKCVLLGNQKCEIEPTLINLQPNQYSQELHYYPFALKLDRCVGSCNTLNDLANEVCVTEDLNLSVFNMITGINESKTNHISCEWKCKFDGRKCNSNQWWNNNKC